MATQASYEDANLILRLYEIRREEKMRAARSWYAANFRPKSFEELGKFAPPGSQENTSMRQVATYYEMVASFITSGVLNKELYFQSGGEMLLTYLRMKPVLADMRNAWKNPDAFKNLEKVAEDLLNWYGAKEPGAREAVIARLG